MGMSKYDRMLHILNLLRTRRNMNAERLAHECGVTERSIYRDIISLSEMNVPIFYDNGYKLASDNFLPPLNFSLDEYNLLKLALESSPLIQTDKYRGIYHGVRAKIESCLPDKVRQETKIQPDTTRIEIAAADELDDGEQYYSLLEKAISEELCIDLTYQSIRTGTTQRVVDPYFIIFRGRAFYFVGYCHLREDFRTFRINRILGLDLLTEHFTRNQQIRPESYFAGSWSVFSGDSVEVIVRFRGSAAKVISGTTHHQDEIVEILTDGTVRYSIITRGIEEIQRWILGFGDEAEVLAPEELRRRLGRIGTFFSEAYKY
jgi:proteasome accessory factor B